MPPPPPNGLPARLILGPALRAQSDRRLVRLVREGHESAFEEIVRRYRRPLDRFAASIVGGHADDVTQESFRKALVALRGAETDVDLRPWLFRIVRNTALTDLRDRPPAAAQLAEELVAGTGPAAAVAEQRAELRDLTARLRELPENQRTALVMRELEGMSHEEIATAMGISGGAARQAIARARAAVRAGFGALVPLPLLRLLATGDGTGAVAGATGGAAVAGGGAIGAGALKAAVATLVVAGAVGAGVAIQHGGGGGTSPKDAPVATLRSPSKGAAAVGPAPSTASAESDRNARPAVEVHRAHRSGGAASEHHITHHHPGNGGPRPLATSPAVQMEAVSPGQRNDGGGAPGTRSHAGGQTGGGETGGGGPHQGGDGEGSGHGGDGSSSSSSGEETRQGADGGGGGAESGSSRSGGGDGGSGDGIETEHETATGESGGSDDPTPTLLSGDSESADEGAGTSSTPDAEPQPSSPTPESGGSGGDGTTESTDGSGSS
ncbi:MAG: sigma-70 family RNA polymerase sigma factor [Actinobacteria bacterium]|nr:sigma-70 family RNA polymerase sigma factor [Actinomycetota bacterium]